MKAAYLSTTTRPDRGAEPDLPRAADADRDGARLRVAADQLVARRGRACVRRSSSCSRSRSSSLYPYFEAPGFAILTIPNRHWRWDNETCSCCCSGCSRVSLLAARVAPARRPSPRPRSCSSLAWMLTARDRGDRRLRQLRQRASAGSLPQQLDWVDRETGGQPVTFLGQAISDPNGLLADGVLEPLDPPRLQPRLTAPGPGPDR